MPLRKGGTLQENWVRQDGKTLQGRGLKIVDRDTTVQESIQLTYSERGFWYVPTVPDQNGAKPVPFKMVRAEDRMYVFENPKHDFPQRISYRFYPQKCRRGGYASRAGRIPGREQRHELRFFAKITTEKS